MKTFFLALAILSMAFGSSVQSNAQSGSVLLFDTFKDKSNTWTEEDNASARIYVDGTNYNFENKTEGQYMSWKNLYMGYETNFEVWAVTRHSFGVNSFGYGLIFGGSDTKNTHEFMIAQTGYFKIGYWEYGTWHTVQDWTTSTAINTALGSENDVGVISLDGTWHYLVNEVLVTSLTARNFYGNNFGMVVENKQAIVFDDFEVVKGIRPEVNEVTNTPTQEVKPDPGYDEDDEEFDIDWGDDDGTVDPATLPVNHSLVVPSDFAGKLQLVACDYPDNFANVRGEKKPKGEYALSDNYYSPVQLQGFQECYFSQDFLGNRLSFIASYETFAKSEALGFYNEMKEKLLSVTIPCTGRVYDERIDEDPESSIPFNTYWLPFNLDEPAATDFTDFLMELEVMKSFGFDANQKFGDVWLVTLRVKKM